MSAPILNRGYMDEGGAALARAQHAVNRLMYAGQQAGYFPADRVGPIVGIGTQAPGAAGQVVQNGRVLELSQAAANQVAGIPPQTTYHVPVPRAAIPAYFATVGRAQQAQGLAVLLHELAHTQQTLVRNPAATVPTAPSPSFAVPHGTQLPMVSAVEGGASAFEHALGQHLANLAGFHVRVHDTPDVRSPYGAWRQQVNATYGPGYVTRGQFR